MTPDRRKHPAPTTRDDERRRILREYRAKSDEIAHAKTQEERERLQREQVAIAAQTIDLLEFDEPEEPSLWDRLTKRIQKG